MKQKDIALIIVIAFISAIFSLVLAKTFMGGSKSRSTQVEVVNTITSDFLPTRTRTNPDSPDNKEYNEKYGKYFNEKSYNWTQVIEIGGDNNPNPTPFNQNP